MRFSISVGIVSLFLPFVTSLTARAEIELSAAKATIYEAGTNREKPVFRYTRTVTPLANGATRAEAKFTSPDGALVYAETTEARGDRILNYDWSDRSIDESGSVTVRGDHAKYVHEKSGKAETDRANAAENLVIGPTMIPYVQNHWAELLRGDSIPVRVGVPDRMNDYGFRFRREKDSTANEIHISLAPTSFFVSLAVKPVDFYFTPDGSRLLRTRGFTFLRVKKNGKWENLVAETVFE